MAFPIVPFCGMYLRNGPLFFAGIPISLMGFLICGLALLALSLRGAAHAITLIAMVLNGLTGVAFFYLIFVQGIC